MARLPRFTLAGMPHLVVQRGHNGSPIVIDDEDRRSWRTLLAEAAATERVAVHAWGLGETQFGLVLTPPRPASLGAVLQSIGRRYVAAFNRRHGRRGTLWDGRFRSCVLEPGPRVIDCMLYVEGAWAVPGLTPDPGGTEPDGQASSLPHHLGQRQDALVVDPPAYWALGNTPFDRQAAYRRLAEGGGLPGVLAGIERAVGRGRPLGSELFLARLEAETGQTIRPRPRGRPPRRGDQGAGG